MLDLLWLAVPVACASWTIAQTEIFRWLREGVKAWAYRNEKPRSLFHHLVAYLPTCYYCTSHYVGEFFLITSYVAGFKKLDFTNGWTSAIAGFIIATFTLVGIANLYLTGFNIYRVVLRYCQALADRQEAMKELAQSKLRQLRKTEQEESYREALAAEEEAQSVAA